MRDSLNAGGLLYPVRIRLEEDGTLVPEDGHYRIAGASELGWTHIPALVVQTPTTDAETTLRQLTSFQRFDLNVMDRALAYDRVLRQAGMTAERLAAAVGQSVSQVCRLRALIGCKPEVQELVASGRLGGSVAVLLSLVPEDRYPDLLQRAREGKLTRADLEENRRSARRRPRTRLIPSLARPRRSIALGHGCKLTVGVGVGTTRDLLDLLTQLVEQVRRSCEAGVTDLAEFTPFGTPAPSPALQ